MVSNKGRLSHEFFQNSTDTASVSSLEALFNAPYNGISLREWCRETNAIIQRNKKMNLFTSPSMFEPVALSLEKAGHVRIDRGSKPRAAWIINLTDKGFDKCREYYLDSRKTFDDGNMIEKLIEEGAEWIVSSPRTITLFGEYAIGDARNALPAKALGMAINSRTYIGFERTQSLNEHRVGRMFLYKHDQWDENSWKQSGVKNLEEWYTDVRGEWNAQNPDAQFLKTNYPKITVVADCPGNIGLNLSASAMPAFVVGLFLFFQNESKMNGRRIRTTHGELTDNEKEIIRKAAEASEKLYAEKRGMKICSGIHSTTSTQGGIVYFENNRKEDIHCEQVPFSRAKNQFPIAIVEPAELEKNTSPAAMARVFEYKDQLGEIDKENQIFETVYMIMNRVTQLGKKSLEAYDLRKLGSLMTLQHDLLRTIGASDPSVELLLLEIAKIDFGNSDAILGAKITGAGGKGSSILILYNPTCFGKNIRDEFVGRIEEFKGVLAESIAHERGVSVEMPPKRSEYSTVSPVLSSQDRARLLREKTR